MNKYRKQKDEEKDMRLAKREIKDAAVLREIIEECDVVRIGVSDQDGMFIVPVNYGYEFAADRDTIKLTLYIHGAKEGRKAEAFAAAPSVALEMDCRHELITGGYTCSYSYAYRSIMGNGRIRCLDTEEEKRMGLVRIMEHLAPGAAIEFRPEMLAKTNVYRIDVTDFTGKERRRK